jgi:starch phosphorylase
MLVRHFDVTPSLPAPLGRLRDLAYNLWWSWDSEASQLFERVNSELFQDSRRNPVQLLADLPTARFEELAADPSFSSHMEGVLERFDHYMSSASKPDSCTELIAYFCAEFGLHECLPLYSGGLGVLAGDTLKSASDRGVPLVAVGLAYRFGYFRQRIHQDGTQEELYPENDFSQLPMSRLVDERGQAIRIEVEMDGRRVAAQVWQVQVGRVPLYLLDTNLPDSPKRDRLVTSRLYAGDLRMRLEQEMMLGIGGVEALRTLGWKPSGYHMNEGHSAFLTLSQTRTLQEEQDLSFDEARHLAAAANLFTTHTPVPAGHDEFDQGMLRGYLEPYADRLQTSWEEVLHLGQRDPDDPDSPFSMTVLGMRMSRHRNAVSALHGKVSRSMWEYLWPGHQGDEVPIRHVTNGVHLGTWLSRDLARLLDRYLPEDWSSNSTDPQIWEKIGRVPDQELWRQRCLLRQRLVEEVRARVRAQVRRNGTASGLPQTAEKLLDPEVLTVGFCRRFATYKRATLLFHDPERLTRIVRHAKRPVQFLFSGKAHPQDEPGKQFIREIVSASFDERFFGRIVFLEDYDLSLAQILVQGVDVWLNTPRRPLEASGTSGMKAALNGALNLSISDGWWCEGYRGDNGWVIGEESDAGDNESRDLLDVASLYDLLEREVAPLFHDRGTDGVPSAWIQRVKASMCSLIPAFNSDRMMLEYQDQFYRNMVRDRRELIGASRPQLQEFVQWWQHMNGVWPEVRILEVNADLQRSREVGEQIPVTVVVASSAVQADDLRVEILHGPTDNDGKLLQAQVSGAPLIRSDGDQHRYEGSIPCRRSGRHGMAVRIRPAIPGVCERFEAPFAHWG